MTGILEELADEAALAHPGAPGERVDMKIAREVLEAPELDPLNGGDRGELRLKLGREL